jgi:hypothetical protein
MDAGAVFTAAFFRGLMLALLSGAGAAVSAMLAGMDDRSAILTGVAVFATTMTGRVLAEGGYDANRAKTGDIHSSDVGVGQTITKITKTGTGGR